MEAAGRRWLRRWPDSKQASTGPRSGASGAAPSLTPREPTAFLQAVRQQREKSTEYAQASGGSGDTRRAGTAKSASPGRHVAACVRAGGLEASPWLSTSRGLTCHAVPVSLAIEPPGGESLAWSPVLVRLTREFTSAAQFLQVLHSPTRDNAPRTPSHALRRVDPQQPQPGPERGRRRSGQPQPGADPRQVGRCRRAEKGQRRAACPGSRDKPRRGPRDIGRTRVAGGAWPRPRPVRAATRWHREVRVRAPWKADHRQSRPARRDAGQDHRPSAGSKPHPPRQSRPRRTGYQEPA